MTDIFIPPRIYLSLLSSFFADGGLIPLHAAFFECGATLERLTEVLFSCSAMAKIDPEAT